MDYRSLESHGLLRRQEKTGSKKESILRGQILKAGLETDPGAVAKGNETEMVRRTQNTLIRRMWPKLENIYQS